MLAFFKCLSVWFFFFFFFRMCWKLASFTFFFNIIYLLTPKCVYGVSIPGMFLEYKFCFDVPTTLIDIDRLYFIWPLFLCSPDRSKSISFFSCKWWWWIFLKCIFWCLKLNVPVLLVLISVNGSIVSNFFKALSKWPLGFLPGSRFVSVIIYYCYRSYSQWHRPIGPDCIHSFSHSLFSLVLLFIHFSYDWNPLGLNVHYHLRSTIAFNIYSFLLLNQWYCVTFT